LLKTQTTIKKGYFAKRVIILLVISYFILMFGNGYMALTNPDEVFYTQTAREMVQQNTWITPYLFGAAQFEKPILTYWLLRIGFIIFGVGPFAARFFPALFGMIGVVGVYLFGILAFKDEKKSFLAAIIMCTSGLYVGLSRTVFTDMIFSVFILLSLLAFFWGYLNQKKNAGTVLFYIFAGLAVLTKGPLGLAIPLLAILIFLFREKNAKYLFCKASFWGFIAFALICLPWYIVTIKKYGMLFINEFFYNDHIRRLLEAEHKSNDTWFFYPATMIGCMFPWAFYVLGALIYLFRCLKERVNFFLFSWILTVFLTFQFAHSKLTSYIFPMFPALALVTADFIHRFTLNTEKRRAIFTITLGAVFVFAVIPAGLFWGVSNYPDYVHNRIAVYIFACFLIILAFSILFSALRRQFLRAACITALFMPLVLGFTRFIYKDTEPYMSSYAVCKYLEENYPVEGVVFASKFFARGVRLYTDREVAVADFGGKNFFSPAPIPFFSRPEDAMKFMRRQPVTYCVVKEGMAERFQRIAEEKAEFKYSLLKVIGNAYLVKMEFNGKINS